MIEVNIEPAPGRFLPWFAAIHGMEVSAIIEYCARLQLSDKLPRGMDKRLEKLRTALNLHIRNLQSNTL